MNWTTYDNLTGYDLWHRRLGHVPNRNIEQTIQHSIWLENLIGYNHAIIYRNSGMRWQYGMKTKDETLDMAKRWFAEIADVRIHYPLIMVVRDNSGENTSKELNDFFTSHGVKN